MSEYLLWFISGVMGVIVILNLIMFRQFRHTVKRFKNTIQEKEKINRSLRRLAHTDDLTGLYNYRFLVNQLEKEIKRANRVNEPLSIMMLDIDYFKNYNDQNGHPEGDKLLSELSRVIKENARGVDTVTRYGGEEFCVILVDINVKVAVHIAERMRRAIENHPFKNRETQPGGKITVSIGVAGYPEHGVRSGELIMMADRALYKAKLKRNHVEMYNPEMDECVDEPMVAGLYQ